MSLWPTTPQGVRSRIASYRRILRAELAASAYGGDGYGRRYWLFCLYFLLREDDEAGAYIDWYTAQFPDDMGEVSQFVCWALILHRMGRENEAVYRFVQTIENNLPVVADVVGDLQAPYGIGGAEEIWELYRVDEGVIKAMTADERQWLKAMWHAPAVTAMRLRYLASSRAYVAAQTREEREALGKEQRSLVRAFMPATMWPLSADPSGQSWLQGGRSASRKKATKGRVIRTTPEVWRGR
jgi:hypothetical protein